MKEIYVTCQYDNSYLIGDHGTVKRTNSSIIKRYKTDILKGLLKPDGYKMYWINNKWYYSHRLVGIHFIPNPNNYPEINHIDGVKSNNCIYNLEWCTHSQNHKHRFDVLGHKIPSGQASWLRGHEVSAETRKAMSDQKIGSKHPKFKGWYIVNGKPYASSYEAGKVLNRSNRTVIRWCKSGINSCSFKSV